MSHRDLTERIRVYLVASQREGDETADSQSESDGLHAGEREDARAVARDGLHDHGVTDVDVNGDDVTVYCGPYTGYHGLRRDPDGTTRPCTYGSYVHDPTGVEFEAECPDPPTLDAAVREASTGPNPGDTARATYRSSRL